MVARGNRVRMNGRGVAGAVVLGMGLLLPPGAARAEPPPPSIVIVPGSQPPYPAFSYPYAQPLWCWSAVRVFRTLRNGNFPYCRQNLRYRPGALECFQVTEQVCEVLPAGAALPIQTTSPLNKQVIACPDGPPPPVCRRLDIEPLPLP
jgi:hypothetical protein